MNDAPRNPYGLTNRLQSPEQHKAWEEGRDAQANYMLADLFEAVTGERSAAMPHSPKQIWESLIDWLKYMDTAGWRQPPFYPPDVDHEMDEDCICGPTPIFEPGGTVWVHHPLVDEIASGDAPPREDGERGSVPEAGPVGVRASVEPPSVTTSPDASEPEEPQ